MKGHTFESLAAQAASHLLAAGISVDHLVPVRPLSATVAAEAAARSVSPKVKASRRAANKRARVARRANR